MTTKMDADERQEYQCLLLEGVPDSVARKRARSANNAVNSRRLAGPRSADRNGHGDSPLVSDFYFNDMLDEVVPVTLDTRTDLEREQDWESSDKARRLLDYLTDIQRNVIVDLYGLETGEPMSYLDVAVKHGHTSAHWTRKTRTQALARIRRFVENPPMTAEERLEHKRKLRREQRRRERAKKKNGGI